MRMSLVLVTEPGEADQGASSERGVLSLQRFFFRSSEALISVSRILAQP